MVVTILIIVGTELGLLNVITNTAGSASFTVGLLIVNVGIGSLSTIVVVPVAVLFNVLPDVTVAVNV